MSETATRHRCCCVGHDPAPDCWGEWELPAGERPETFLLEPICGPCLRDLRATLADLKTKGVTLEVNYGEKSEE